MNTEMQKTSIQVPLGIKYIGDWTGFELPDRPHIMNKVVTGCGFTEYFLRPNPKYPKVILISPRRVLLENKEDQHNNPSDGVDIGEVYYARNDMETVVGYDADLNSTKAGAKDSTSKVNEEAVKARLRKFHEDLDNYLNKCNTFGLDIRIMVTYDSLRHVLEHLGSGVHQYQIVVDEFQSIFTDSKFKSDTELELLHHLQGLQKVCFLSATPMLDTYLELLDEFKSLPYYQLDWETLQPGRVHCPNLDCKQVTSIVTAAREEIDKYLRGEFERYSWRDENGNIQETFSTELCSFLNSVKTACDIIRICGLRPEQCNILCAQTEENRKKINQAFKAVDPSLKLNGKNLIGSVPKKGEPHKMFTFCTRTVYLGADFYSTCARTLILSDANIDCLSVDISMDLPQILGRQRLTDINPWANSAMFRFKTNTKKITQEEFDGFIADKVKKTESLLKLFYSSSDSDAKHAGAEVYQRAAIREKYKYNYVAVNHHAGSDLKPVFNKLVLVAERRTFDIQKIDYKDRFSVLSEVNEAMGIDPRSKDINDYLKVFNQIGLGREKMRSLCDFLKVRKDLEEEILMNIPLTFKNYYTVLGPRRCWAFSYQICKLEEEYQKQLAAQRVSPEDLRDLVHKNFQEGERILNSDLKKAVQGIYDSFGLKRTGKAKDFEQWFEMKPCTIPNPVTKKRENGFELLKKKL